MPDLVGVGAINLDFILDSAQVGGLSAADRDVVLARFEHGTERPASEPEILDALERVAALRPVVSPGGSALNTVTVAARSCGVGVGYVGVCGRSPSERFDFPAWFRRVGVDARNLRHSEQTCGLCVSYTHGGQRSMLTWDGANDEIFAHLDASLDELLGYCGTARVVHATSFAGGRDPASLARLLRRLRAEHPGVLISVDPGARWSIPGRPPSVDDLVDVADYVFVNAREFDLLTGRPPRATDVDAASRFFRDRPRMAGFLVLKRHDRVQLFRREGRGVAERAFANSEVLESSAILDDTGAGDAFAAGFLSGVGLLGLDTAASVSLGQRLARAQLQSVGMLGLTGTHLAIMLGRRGGHRWWDAATVSVQASPAATGPRVSRSTLRRLERASGRLAAASTVVMAERLPWFRRLTADQRAAVLLVTQTGAANFVAWLSEPDETIRLTAEAFRSAPRELARRVTLRQTVELVRVAVDVFENQLPALASDAEEQRALIEAVLRFGREIAFAAATVYASAAESRGAWDARLEALVVDGVVRADADDALVSRSSALGWDPAAPLAVMVGAPPPDNPPELLSELRRAAGKAGRSALAGVQGPRLVVLLSGDAEPLPQAEAAATMAEAFGPGPVVVGPIAAGLAGAHASARDAIAGLRAVAAWPEAPRPVSAADLLPERVLSGDPEAAPQLVQAVLAPVVAAGGELLSTLAAYLEVGGVLEACARKQFVHPNTVRYRLRRVAQLTGRTPTDSRDAVVLRFALMAGRLAGSDEPAQPR